MPYELCFRCSCFLGCTREFLTCAMNLNYLFKIYNENKRSKFYLRILEFLDNGFLRTLAVDINLQMLHC